jgi:alginate O-acetyltransferase complex protein AlgJ
MVELSVVSVNGDSATCLTRRALFGGVAGCALGALAPRHANAAIVGLVVVGKNDWLFPIWDEVRSVDPQKIHKVTSVINEAVGVLKKSGTEVVISLTPAKSRVYREFLPDDFRFSADADKRYALALDDLRRPGTLVPDLATVLINARKANPTEDIFFKTDTHWTPSGSEPAGMEIARAINERLRLPPSATPGANLGDYAKMIQAKNDLAELLPPADKAKYPAQPYKVRRVLPAAGQQALLEDDAADTVLIGNSYTQPKYGFSAVISKQLNRPVALVWKVHQFGPYHTMLEYVNSAAFKQRRPKLIIWDFEETDMEAASDRSDVWGQNAMPPANFLAGLRKAVGA